VKQAEQEGDHSSRKFLWISPARSNTAPDGILAKDRRGV
jgi:hypothetical protein